MKAFVAAFLFTGLLATAYAESCYLCLWTENAELQASVGDLYHEECRGDPGAGLNQTCDAQEICAQAFWRGLVTVEGAGGEATTVASETTTDGGNMKKMETTEIVGRACIAANTPIEDCADGEANPCEHHDEITTFIEELIDEHNGDDEFEVTETHDTVACTCDPTDDGEPCNDHDIVTTDCRYPTVTCYQCYSIITSNADIGDLLDKNEVECESAGTLDEYELECSPGEVCVQAMATSVHLMYEEHHDHGAQATVRGCLPEYEIRDPPHECPDSYLELREFDNETEAMLEHLLSSTGVDVDHTHGTGCSCDDEDLCNDLDLPTTTMGGADHVTSGCLTAVAAILVRVWFQYM